MSVLTADLWCLLFKVISESEDDLTDSSIWREVSEQQEVQEKSREKVLKMADYIVPGHGKMFPVSHAYKTA